ncbi:MAG TPA: substrate-binding domain-containing protein, partial [Reyranella sp.]
PAATEAATAAPAAAEAGVAKNPPDKANQPITILDVPKLVGIGYFAATAKGMQDAAKELGNVTVKTDAPTEAKIEKQIEFIDNDITQQPDAIVFASNDPVAIAPVLKKALDAGIRVVGYDADAQPDAREWFVNQATFEGIGQAMLEDMVKQVGEDAEVAFVTSSLTAPNNNRWIDEIKKAAATKYPKLKFDTTLPSEEDQQLAFKAAQDIMKSYPNVKGIFGMSSVAFPGATDAVKQAGQCGKIAVVGLSTPNQMRPFMKEGCIKSVVLWNPVDLGYATVYAVRALVDGKLKPGATELEAGKLGKLKITGSEILLGPPFIFTPDNIDKFDF